MRITLFHSFHFVCCSTVYNKRGEYCIYRSQPETEMSCTAGGGDVLYSRRRRCLVWLETKMSCMAGDEDVSYGRRWLLTLVRADRIQPYWYVHIYTGLVALLDRIQLSFSSITIWTPTCWIWGEPCMCLDLDTERREKEKDASYVWEKCALTTSPLASGQLYIYVQHHVFIHNFLLLAIKDSHTDISRYHKVSTTSSSITWLPPITLTLLLLLQTWLLACKFV